MSTRLVWRDKYVLPVLKGAGVHMIPESRSSM